MTPSTLIERASADGVGLMLTPAGTLKLTGEQEKVHRWLGVLRQYKPAIVEALRAKSATTTPTTERATTWRIRYADGTERIIATSPPRTREEVLHAEIGAAEAVAHAPGKTPPERPLLEDERTRIRRWLELIGETDEATIAKVLAAAAEDSTARHYYLERFRDWEERAAVAEFDGGLPRQEAERLAAAHPLEATEESRAALRAARQAFGDPSPRL
jgi:hypothetical protein